MSTSWGAPRSERCAISARSNTVATRRETEYDWRIVPPRGLSRAALIRRTSGRLASRDGSVRRSSPEVIEPGLETFDLDDNDAVGIVAGRGRHDPRVRTRRAARDALLQ